ncbi:hypothetical protein GH714_026909 [Hevea brasiliensis]|uniref:Uncharacterized protein n=1 Tax=Hevea brasiliensis TaxID=3981 RepID=A0A6A6N3R0_HEVBR|nr:hypothetical protein GH714_026909 [Hevea brasiliensis]
MSPVPSASNLPTNTPWLVLTGHSTPHLATEANSGQLLNQSPPLSPILNSTSSPSPISPSQNQQIFTPNQQPVSSDLPTPASPNHSVSNSNTGQVVTASTYPSLNLSIDLSHYPLTSSHSNPAAQSDMRTHAMTLRPKTMQKRVVNLITKDTDYLNGSCLRSRRLFRPEILEHYIISLA